MSAVGDARKRHVQPNTVPPEVLVSRIEHELTSAQIFAGHDNITGTRAALTRAAGLVKQLREAL